MKYECLKLEERRIIEEMYAKGAKPARLPSASASAKRPYTASSSEARPGKRTPAFVKGIARR